MLLTLVKYSELQGTNMKPWQKKGGNTFLANQNINNKDQWGELSYHNLTPLDFYCQVFRLKLASMSICTIGCHHRKANIFINKYQELTCLPVEEILMNAFSCTDSLNTLCNQSQALN